LETTRQHGEGPEAADNRLAVQSAVARALTEATTVADATRRVLGSIGETLGWRLGAVWELTAGGERIRCVETWNAPGTTASAFEEASREAEFEPGVGLPGRVWADGASAWVRDVTTDPNFPRAGVAAECGVRGAFAFPIRSARGVLGVVEFFTVEAAEPDGYLLDLMTTIGHQLGQQMERSRAEAAVRTSEARKSAMLDASLDAIVSMSAGGRVVEFNAAAERIFGYRAEEALGQEMAELIVPPALREMHRAGLSRYLETGEARVLDRRLEIMGMRADGSELPVELTIRRADIDGPPLFTGFIRDITARKRREAFDRFLAEAGALLGASLDVEETLESVTRLAVPAIADWCAVDLVSDTGTLRRVAAAHADPSKTELAYELARRWPGSLEDPGGFGLVIRTGEPEFYEELPEDSWAYLDAEYQGIVKSLGLRSLVIVPLPSPTGRTLGGLALVTAESGRLFDEQDVGLALELGRRCAVAIDNARLYEERSRIADTLQRSLLPADLPEVPGMALDARFRPAGEGIEMGGDFYDVFPLGDERWAVVLADVCGKGPDAAALTALVRYTVRAVAMHEHAPDRVLTLLNEAILRHRGDDRFCSAVFATLETRPDGARVELASGGHPPPLILRADGYVEAACGSGLLLGLWPDPDVETEGVDLRPGDALIFYTDGVTDARAPDRILSTSDLARLVGSCAGRGATATADAIESVVTEAPAEPRDDLALLVVSVDAATPAAQPAPPAAGGLRVTLESRPESAAEARQAVETLNGSVAPTVIDELKLLVTELVTNSCRHSKADGGVVVEVGLDGATVRLAVIDSGPGFEAQVPAGDLLDESGRGLFIVDALADRWGVDTAAGTRVWAEVDLGANGDRRNGLRYAQPELLGD
jgi:PAS domain S-box-containing protein